MKTIAVNEFCEIVSGPNTLGPKDQIIVQDAELPEIDNALSVTLRLKLKSHASGWTSVFFKGRLVMLFTRVLTSEIVRLLESYLNCHS